MEWVQVGRNCWCLQQTEMGSWPWKTCCLLPSAGLLGHLIPAAACYWWQWLVFAAVGLILVCSAYHHSFSLQWGSASLGSMLVCPGWCLIPFGWGGNRIVWRSGLEDKTVGAFQGFSKVKLLLIICWGIIRGLVKAHTFQIKEKDIGIEGCITTCGFHIVLFCSGSWVVAVFQLGWGGSTLPALRPSGIFVVSLKTASDSRREKRCLR